MYCRGIRGAITVEHNTREEILAATTELGDVVALDVVLMVAPAQHVRGVAGALAPHLPAGKPVVLCAKGLEQATPMRQCGRENEAGGARDQGPSHEVPAQIRDAPASVPATRRPAARWASAR